MKRIIGAIAAGVVAFSGIYALAASLTVSSDNLGAGTTAVAACQATAFTVTYPAADITYSAATPGYMLTGATVTGLTATCDSTNYQLTVYGAGGTSLASATGATPSSGSSFTVTLSASVSIASITNVALVVGQ